MSHGVGAFASAEAQVAAVRDDPASRVALMARLFHGPTGRAPRHVPFRLAALSFMRWQAQRGVLNPIHASPPGSVWWRAMNERLLRDGCEAIGLLGGFAGDPSAHAVRLWLEFSAMPTGRNWYRAHNASIVGGYLDHRDLAEAENAPERFFMNVALVRVLYAHVLVGAPSLALGRFAPLGRMLGDPRLGMAGVFLPPAIRSTPGPTNSATYGAVRAHHSQPGYSNALLAPAEITRPALVVVRHPTV